MKVSSLPPQTRNLTDAIVGLWVLKSREDIDADGHVVFDPFLGDDPLGMLCFGPHHFAAQFMKRDRSRAEEIVQRAPASNNSAGVDGYDAYFGSYALDESAGTLTTQIEGSISPLNIGNEYKRDVRVVENKLLIRLNTTAIDGREVTRTNTFVRLG